MTFENNYKSIINFINSDETISENFNKMVAAYELDCFLSATHVMKIDGEIVELKVIDYLTDDEIEGLFKETYDKYVYENYSSPSDCAEYTLCEFLYSRLEEDYGNDELEYYQGENEYKVYKEYLKEAYKEKKEKEE